MKKLFAILLAVSVLLCSAAFAAEYAPAIGNGETLTCMRYIRDIDNIEVNGLWANEHLEELTGVHIEYTAVSQSDFPTQLNLMFASGEYPDIVVACFGGGSNFSGISFPFMRHNILDGAKTKFIAAEPSSCPKMTQGTFEYDFGDEAGYTPLIKMYTLGHKFTPANIHAGGLRYHGAGSIVSQLYHDGMMEAADIPQVESFDAAALFAKAEGIVPAPESGHAIAAAIREAVKCREAGEKKVILFNLTGHGMLDMASYDQYLRGNLVNYTYTK